MKRAPIVLSATVAGLAGTLAFHARSPAATATTTPQAATSSSTAPARSSTTATKSVTSEVVANQYGDVQLKVTVAGAKITKIQALELPGGDPKSSEINAAAAPVLQASALSAQSANIDSVSGATYTSTSYKTALQSALDKAGLPASAAKAS